MYKYVYIYTYIYIYVYVYTYVYMACEPVTNLPKTSIYPASVHACNSSSLLLIQLQEFRLLVGNLAPHLVRDYSVSAVDDVCLGLHGLRSTGFGMDPDGSNA